MGRRATVAVLAVVASLALANTARADVYQVLGNGDGADPAPCNQIQPGSWQCDSLRRAAAEANGRAGPDSIGPLSGTYTLQFGSIGLADDTTLLGSGARSTTITAGGRSQVINVAAGQTGNVYGLTIADGFGSGEGGNILVGQGATLTLAFSHVTRGTATQGAGIANQGTVTLGYSLVDGNVAQTVGGAIYNHGSLSNPATVQISDSTLANNTAPEGAGIYSAGNGANDLVLAHATIARNVGGGGLSFDGQQNLTVFGSVIAANGGGDCRGGEVSPGAGRTSVESGASCGLTDASNRQGNDAGIAAALSNEGGETNVLTIPAGSVAVDLDTPCLSAQDQRGAVRAAGGTCDAGAFEQGGTGTQSPQPTPTPAQPAPTATPSPTPTPVANQTVVAGKVSGTLRIKVKGTNQFVEFDATKGIPLGSEIDARKGEVEITSVSKPGAPPEKAKFHDGIFRVTQSGPITVLTLTEQLAACPKKKGRAAAAAAKKPKVRRLWGDGKGKFRTSGKYAAATVRGTEWLVQDSCAGTLVRVKQGTVTVRDNVRKKNKLLRAPKSYLAKPK
jgi:hypothetical protein